MRSEETAGAKRQQKRYTTFFYNAEPSAHRFAPRLTRHPNLFLHRIASLTAAQYALGMTDEVKGTGVWKDFELKREEKKEEEEEEEK